MPKAKKTKTKPKTKQIGNGLPNIQSYKLFDTNLLPNSQPKNTLAVPSGWKITS